MALASAGATASASSTLNLGLTAVGAINGDRKGVHWGADPATGSGWHDSTGNAYPDWLEVRFAGVQTIDEVSVFTVQDNYQNPAAPTEAMTFTQYGVTDFQFEYWDTSVWPMAWKPIKGTTVAGNRNVWRRFTFAPVTTDKIRVVVTGALGSHSRITEVEAWSGAATQGGTSTQAAGVKWLVSDQLGTPRMLIDQTGAMSGVTRHDYLPFGDELTAGREAARGYKADGVRQKFTGYERDAEINLDYAQARYFAPKPGRFVSPDPLLASGMTSAPQSWNRYTYALSNPLRFTDPSGMFPQTGATTQANTPPPQERQVPPPVPVEWKIDVVAYNETTIIVEDVPDYAYPSLLSVLMGWPKQEVPFTARDAQIGGGDVKETIWVGPELQAVADEIMVGDWPRALRDAGRDATARRVTGFDSMTTTNETNASREIGSSIKDGPSATNNDSFGRSTSTTVQGDRASRFTQALQDSQSMAYDTYRLTSVPIVNPASQFRNGHYLDTGAARALRNLIYERNDRIARTYF